MSDKQYNSKPDETLGAYLKRLRMLAGQVQLRSISQDEVATMTAEMPAPQRFTAAWLSKIEADRYEQPGGDKLRTLAEIYSRLLRSNIPAEWLLFKAGFEIKGNVLSLADKETLNSLLQHEGILALVAAAGHLMEMGHPEDVELLVTIARRYINARDPERRLEDIFEDAVLSTHVRSFMEALQLT